MLYIVLMVYLIADKQKQWVKIGYSTDPIKRLTTLQTGMPMTLELVCTIEGSRSIEQEIQSKFDHLWIRGEWYTYSEDIKKYVEGRGVIQPVKAPRISKAIGDYEFNSYNPLTFEMFIDKNIPNTSTQMAKWMIEHKDENNIVRMEWSQISSSKSMFYKNIEILLKYGIVARGSWTDKYYINPVVMFKGERITIVMDYIRDKIPDQYTKDIASEEIGQINQQ